MWITGLLYNSFYAGKPAVRYVFCQNFSVMLRSYLSDAFSCILVHFCYFLLGGEVEVAGYAVLDGRCGEGEVDVLRAVVAKFQQGMNVCGYEGVACTHRVDDVVYVVDACRIDVTV